MNLTSRGERIISAVLSEIRKASRANQFLSADDLSMVLPYQVQEIRDALDELVRCKYLMKLTEQRSFRGHTSTWNVLVYFVNVHSPHEELPPGYRWYKDGDSWCIVSSRHSATMGVLILPSDYVRRLRPEGASA